MPCVEVWQTSNLWPLRLGEEKEIEDRKKPQGKNIMACPITSTSTMSDLRAAKS